MEVLHEQTEKLRSFFVFRRGSIGISTCVYRKANACTYLRKLQYHKVESRLLSLLYSDIPCDELMRSYNYGFYLKQELHFHLSSHRLITVWLGVNRRQFVGFTVWHSFGKIILGRCF